MKKKTIKSVFGLQKGVAFLALMFFFGLAPTASPQKMESNADTLVYITCKGIVTDAATNMPLSYASVMVEGTNLASVTNADGEFSLKVPQHLKNNYLLVTYIGFQNERIQIANFGSEVRRISMKIAEVGLSEVKIVFKNAEELMRTVFDLKKENYVTE